MAKTSATTGSTTDVIHTRTTAGTEESQAVVVAIDGSDNVVPADPTFGLAVDVKRTANQSAATATLTNVAASATSVTLIAANANRKALYIFNAGTANLFVRLGTTPATTTTGFTHMMPPNSLWELPDDPVYTGTLTGIWAATGGSGANITELT